MSPRLACAILTAFAALIAVPACKKKNKPTEPDSPITPAKPNTSGAGGSSAGPPPGSFGSGDFGTPPRAPVFGGSDPRTAAMRPIAEGDLKQIGLALHSYHDAMGGLPTGFADKQGKPALSWRVAILPYLEQDNLYKQFKLDEPWDSEHNKKLIAKMPKQFAPPRTDTYGYTFCRGFSGPGTWLPPQTGPRQRGVSFAQVSDGLSNTILVAEAAEAVIWTKPEEMEFGQNRVPQLGGVFGTGAHVLVGDGSVRFLRKGFDPHKLALLIQIADGNVASFDD